MDMIDSRTRTLSVPDQDTNMIDVGTRTWSRPGHGHDRGRDTDMTDMIKTKRVSSNEMNNSGVPTEHALNNAT